MSRDNPEITKQGIKHNSNKLTKLINKLDKDIWIKEFWYSMKEHIDNNYPGQMKGPAHALPINAVKDWGEIVKSCL
jgi:hypothetical protein